MSKWVDVNDKLPPNDNEVWVKTSNGDVFLLYCSLDRLFNDGVHTGWSGDWRDPVLHNTVDDQLSIISWMPATIPE